MAPSTPGSYTVQAALNPRPTVFGQATVTVGGAVGVAITPFTGTPIIIPNSKYTFTATVTNTANQQVTWTVNGSPVGIGADGTFTAPAVGSYSIMARSVADPTKTSTLPVIVLRTPTAGLRSLAKAMCCLHCVPTLLRIRRRTWSRL